MTVNLRDYVKASRNGTYSRLKTKGRKLTMSLAFEDRTLKRETHKRFIYCERLDIHTVKGMQVRTWKKIRETMLRMENGHRMVKILWGDLKEHYGDSRAIHRSRL